MRGTGAARRQEREQPPDGAAIDADLRRVIAETDAIIGRMKGHEQAIGRLVVRAANLAAECGNAQQIAFVADKLAARLALTVIETISLAAHNAEAREAAELYAQTVCFNDLMAQAAAEERQKAEAGRSRPARARHRRPRLAVVGGTAAAASIAAASVAGGAIVAHDSASVHPWAASRPAAVRFHAGRPDTAVLVPQARSSYVPRHARKPSADAATASPVPSPLPPSSAAPQPPVPPPAAPPVNYDGVLDVQTAQCVISLGGTGTITFTAAGGAASWSASAPPGIILSQSGGVLASGQPEVVTVTAAPGLAAGSGVVTLTDGSGRAVTVPVTWAAVPGLAV